MVEAWLNKGESPKLPTSYAQTLRHSLASSALNLALISRESHHELRFHVRIYDLFYMLNVFIYAKCNFEYVPSSSGKEKPNCAAKTDADGMCSNVQSSLQQHAWKLLITAPPTIPTFLDPLMRHDIATTYVEACSSSIW